MNRVIVRSCQMSTGSQLEDWCMRLITFFVFAQYVVAVLSYAVLCCLFFFLWFISFFSFFRFFFAQSLECAVCNMPWIGASECRRLSETTLATGYDMHSRMYFPDIPFFLSLDLSSFIIFPSSFSFYRFLLWFIVCHCYFLCSFYRLVNFSYFISFSFFYLSLVFIICRLIFSIDFSHFRQLFAFWTRHAFTFRQWTRHGGMCLVLFLLLLLSSSY
jgi:hypothetical protein